MIRKKKVNKLTYLEKYSIESECFQWLSVMAGDSNTLQFIVGYINNMAPYLSGNFEVFILQ